jgi:hypothetical protein
MICMIDEWLSLKYLDPEGIGMADLSFMRKIGELKLESCQLFVPIGHCLD